MKKQIPALFLLSLPALLYAQVGSGTITGVVKDASLAPIDHASVRVVNANSGAVAAVVTNETGAYRVSSLLPGPYQVEASAPGFDTALRRGVVITTAQVLAVDLTLPVGQQNQTVNVEAGAELTETQTSSQAQVVGHQYIDKLPLPNRSANSLV